MARPVDLNGSTGLVVQDGATGCRSMPRSQDNTLKRLIFSVLFLAPPVMLCAQDARVSATTPPDNSDKVVVEVGDQKITIRDINRMLQVLSPAAQSDFRDVNHRRAFIDKLVEMRLLAGEAHKEGLDQDPMFETRVQMLREQTLIEVMTRKIAEDGLDAEAKAEYETHKRDCEWVSTRQILVRVGDASLPPIHGKPGLSDAQAKAKAATIRHRIVDEKQDFAEIAKAETDDEVSGPVGGEMGQFIRGQLEPPIEHVAFSLKPGEISEPVRSSLGYHIIQVEDHKTPTFEESKLGIQMKLSRTKVEAYVKRLKEAVFIRIDESFAGPPSSSP
jgi:peptidyl-prolyl cis-trans isomerase C